QWLLLASKLWWPLLQPIDKPDAVNAATARGLPILTARPDPVQATAGEQFGVGSVQTPLTVVICGEVRVAERPWLGQPT
ncbi:MAG TPA: hypothetical protein VGP04_16795, partial [Pseudonocardiaceae bacterium]|nr:hypothetical protein [Pseudonocardiaceae bacterium]